MDVVTIHFDDHDSTLVGSGKFSLNAFTISRWQILIQKHCRCHYGSCLASTTLVGLRAWMLANPEQTKQLLSSTDFPH